MATRRRRADSQPPRLEIAFATDVGRERQQNEDAVFCEPPDSQYAEARGILCVVADGMGGHNAGEVASELAIRTTREAYYRSSERDSGAALRAAVAAAHETLQSKASTDPSLQGMGTTLTAAVVHGRTYTLAHVGDSRAYLIHGASANQITRDDSWVQDQIDSGLLTESQGKTHPQGNVLTQALGHGGTPRIQVHQGSLRNGDSLLLCSDGLHRQVPEPTMARTVATLTAPEAATSLVNLANASGGPDNISVVIVQVEPHFAKPSFLEQLGGVRLSKGPAAGGAVAAAVLAVTVVVGLALPRSNAATAPETQTGLSTPTVELPVLVSISPTPVLQAPRETPLPSVIPNSGQISCPNTGEITAPCSYVVQATDSQGLGGIASKLYHDASFYRTICDANPELKQDCDNVIIHPGQKLQIPVRPRT